MTTESPVPHDAPVMVAWTAYKQTEEYANTLRWVNTEHSKGSLWAAFEQGFRAAKDAGPPEPSEEEIARTLYPEAFLWSGDPTVALKAAAMVQALYRSRRA